MQLVWYGVRTRVNVTIRDDKGHVVDSLDSRGPLLYKLRAFRHHVAVNLHFPRSGSFVVSMRKLTSPVPFGSGIMASLLETPSVEFYGLAKISAGLQVQMTPEKLRKIEFIGASDTEGYCVDGTPDMSEKFEAFPNGWSLENCEAAYPGLLGEILSADISVIAIGGIGIIQNAHYHDQQFQFGGLMMPDYWKRESQSDPFSQHDHPKPAPDLVVVDLGGNDFNHQESNVPSNSSFSIAYQQFLDDVLLAYNTSERPVRLAAVCGMGDPTEHKRDRDNDRCSPCPHVRDAVLDFNSKRGHKGSKRGHDLVEFLFVPCDGTVVTGKGDIGCTGHKNRKGQELVAKSLAPGLKRFMGWD